MNFFYKKSEQAFTLIELLVGFVVGTVMAAAIYFSYTIFTNSYEGIVEKTNVNRALRASMNEITHNIRKAGYVDPNQFNPSDVRGFDPRYNINQRGINHTLNSNRVHGSPFIYFFGGNNAPDALGIYFDVDPLNIVFLTFHSIVRDNIRFLERTEYRCIPRSLAGNGNGCTNLDNEKMFGSLEQLKFSFYDRNGVQLLPSPSFRGDAPFTLWTGAITRSIDPLEVNYVQISIIFRSKNEIYKNPVTRTFNIGADTFTYNDRFYREILTSSVYPRNIITNR